MVLNETRPPTDVSDAESPIKAAKQTQLALQDLADKMGHDPDDVLLYVGEEAEARTGNPEPYVAWEGLYDWAMALSGGESALSRDLGWYGGTPEVMGLGHNDNFVAEPYTGTSIQFFKV
jgi:hypothetical protein